MKTKYVPTGDNIYMDYRGLEVNHSIGALWGRKVVQIREELDSGGRVVITYVGETGNPFVTTLPNSRIQIEGVCATDTAFMPPAGMVALPNFMCVESARSYSPDGKPIAEVVAGNGAVKWCTETGHLIWEVHYQNGQRCLERRFHKNHKLATESAWRLGEPHGLVRKWDDEGRPAEERHYENGNRVGIWRTFDATGAVIKEEDWSADPSSSDG